MQLPLIAPVRQVLQQPTITDLAGDVRRQWERSRLPQRLKRGDRVAVGVGSRGIRNIASIARATVDVLRDLGTQPFILAAMGSHGGGTAEGQRGILAAYGVTEQTMRVRIARDELRRLRELTQAIKALEAEIADLVAQIAPHLLTEPRFGPLTAAKLVGEIAGADRFATPAKPARAAGVAPIPASSGNTQRHRLDQDGNRQINAAIHRVAITRARCHPETRAYLDRKRAEGKTTREAIRCLKRHLARGIYHALRADLMTP